MTACCDEEEAITLLLQVAVPLKNPSLRQERSIRPLIMPFWGVGKMTLQLIGSSVLYQLQLMQRQFPKAKGAAAVN